MESAGMYIFKKRLMKIWEINEDLKVKVFSSFLILLSMNIFIFPNTVNKPPPPPLKHDFHKEGGGCFYENIHPSGTVPAKPFLLR